MTYNFDPDRWYDNETAYLQNQLRSAVLSEQEYHKQITELDKRYEEMCVRLDGTYQIDVSKPTGNSGTSMK